MSKQFKKNKQKKSNTGAKNSMIDVRDYLDIEFYDPVDLQKQYPKLKNFKTYDNGKEPERVHYEVEDYIENKRVLLKSREAALKRNIINLEYVAKEIAMRFTRENQKSYEASNTAESGDEA